MKDFQLDELKSAYKTLSFEYKHFDSKKYLSSETRLRMIRNRLPLEYVEEFNQFLMAFTRLEMDAFDMEKMAFRSILANIKTDIGEEEQARKKAAA